MLLHEILEACVEYVALDGVVGELCHTSASKLSGKGCSVSDSIRRKTEKLGSLPESTMLRG